MATSSPQVLAQVLRRPAKPKGPSQGSLQVSMAKQLRKFGKGKK